MSKGELIDFFGKAEITEKEGMYTAIASDIFVKGDKVTFEIEKETKLFISKTFSSFLGEDPIDGTINYKKFKSGISHTDNIMLNLPGKGAVINAKNRDYVQKVM